jgi:aspartyl-tRNA(Asn)/glutamyl-tRNA(Gln) amidotransferase subunit B
LGKLVHLIEKGTITGKIAKSVADEMVLHPGKDPEEIVKENPDFQPIHDTSSIEPLVDQVLAANPQSIADYKAGKGRAFDFLVGQVMKLCKGKASPTVVNEILTKKINRS